MLNALLTFQAMVSWLSANAPVFLNPPRVPGLVLELQSWSYKLPWNPPNPPRNSVLAASRFAWQQPPASTSSVTRPERTQYTPASDAVCSGHNTACHTVLNTLLTFQVAFTVTSQVVECALRSSVLSQPDLPPGALLRSSFVPGVR
ncbi:hypothetical protein HPB51_005144 [Rhipicephalus microplus]|uniref:Secreted protein n=1 Tax=Rhipicephalus microplus TaxID=6941 RepID=A0A9J6EMP3_RHIMP|nr:hypothetical protein HPB51_005144 [Rhipicephalus microplus]